MEPFESLEPFESFEQIEPIETTQKNQTFQPSPAGTSTFECWRQKIIFQPSALKQADEQANQWSHINPTQTESEFVCMENPIPVKSIKIGAPALKVAVLAKWLFKKPELTKRFAGHFNVCSGVKMTVKADIWVREI